MWHTFGAEDALDNLGLIATLHGPAGLLASRKPMVCVKFCTAQLTHAGHHVDSPVSAGGLRQSRAHSWSSECPGQSWPACQPPWSLQDCMSADESNSKLTIHSSRLDGELVRRMQACLDQQGSCHEVGHIFGAQDALGNLNLPAALHGPCRTTNKGEANGSHQGLDWSICSCRPPHLNEQGSCHEVGHILGAQNALGNLSLPATLHGPRRAANKGKANGANDDVHLHTHCGWSE